ncbi:MULTISPECIES: exosortase F system-associated protein [Flavobacterium]|uniref:Exosortase F system-associated protein n=2 Tax=Flavobacterium TaxID=237 RepID=A0ABW8PP62_9FLAO|nr:MULTISPECIES: exosortase F system-associated protein [Flavobacterium]QYS89726.1 exosortase F system-associated protein [Flavobacterium davisii]SPE76423.1 hypothetical protein FLACOL_00403 [Flavobacterium columnare]
MFQKLLKNKDRFVIGVLSITGLILVRNYESDWFYDPFIEYFKGEFQQQLYPDYNLVKLLFNWLLRYFLNTFLSLIFLFVLFREIGMIKIAIILYLFFLFFLILFIFFVLQFFDESYRMTLFYIRRFLIQPLFLILFIPAFYCQKENTKFN